jgi:hypothetical protein
MPKRSQRAQRKTLELAEFMNLSSQIIGNMGLYHVCFQLSLRHWNVMPTSRNARGVDVVAYNVTASEYVGIQVKALSKKSPVPLGPTLDKIMGDFWVIVNNLASVPTSYILRPNEVRKRAHRGEKDGRVSYWLQPKDYAAAEFLEAWDRIGRGAC